MADEAVGSVSSVAVESSPVSVESPTDSGLGATEAKAGPDRGEEAYRKLQSRLDRAERRRQEAEAEASRAYQMIGNARLRQSFEAEMAQAPDPLSDPLGHSRHVKAVALKYYELSEKERVEARSEAANVERSRKVANDYIAQVNAKHGVELSLEDERIVFRGKGADAWRRFTESVDNAAERAALLREIAELKSKGSETLREAGIDRFDGGGAGGGASDSTMSFERWGAMTMKERNAWRRDKPEAVRAMEMRLERRAG